VILRPHLQPSQNASSAPRPGTVLSIQTARVYKPLLAATGSAGARARYRAAYGGRTGGKSRFFAGLLVERCLRQRTRAACIREVQKTIGESVKQAIEDEVRRQNVAEQFRLMDQRTETPYGGHIIYHGMQNHTAESIKSLEGFDLCYVDEAQALSKRSLDILLPTFFRVAGGEMWFSWNPEEPTDPVDQMFRAGEPPPGSIVVRSTYRDNPWFPQDQRELMEWTRRRDPDKYAHIWLGEYRKLSEARVFRNWRVEEFTTPGDARCYFGADWGYAKDPSVLVRCWTNGRTLYVDYEAYKIGCEIDFLPALFDTVPGSRKWPITADNARPETISYMNRHGFPRMGKSIKGVGSVEDGVEFLKNYDIVVHPRCTHTSDELATYSWKTDPHTDEVLPVLEDKQNHVIDSLRYAVEAARHHKVFVPSEGALTQLRRMDEARRMSL